MQVYHFRSKYKDLLILILMCERPLYFLPERYVYFFWPLAIKKNPRPLSLARDQLLLHTTTVLNPLQLLLLLYSALHGRQTAAVSLHVPCYPCCEKQKSTRFSCTSCRSCSSYNVVYSSYVRCTYVFIVDMKTQRLRPSYFLADTIRACVV